MQYSVRTRRRLRPTGEQPPVPSAGEVQGELADGSGAVRRPLITQPVIERISPRAMASSWRR